VYTILVLLQVHETGVVAVQPYVIRLLLVVCSVAGAAHAADADLELLLKGVETRYNHAKTLKVVFHESYTASGHPRQTESGDLTLRKPGRMRWDYSTPTGKLFLSDGKDVYLYTPDAHRVERMKLKESDDMRVPLAFLLGKLDFTSEFRDFVLTPQAPFWKITARAKNDKLPYEHIEMLIGTDYSIQRLVITNQDDSILAFQFDREQVNPAVNDAIFKFQMPLGATLVNGEGGQ
jgi:outer membrane lipoprotein carrier protein